MPPAHPLPSYHSQHVSFLSTFPFDDSRLVTHFMHHPDSRNISCPICAPQDSNTNPIDLNDPKQHIIPPKTKIPHPTLNAPCAYTISMLQGETFSFYGAVRVYVHTGQISYHGYTTKPILLNQRPQQHIKQIPMVCPPLSINPNNMMNISNPSWFSDSILQIQAATDCSITLFPSTSSLQIISTWDPLQVNFHSIDGIDIVPYLHEEAVAEASMIHHTITRLYSYPQSPFHPQSAQYSSELANLCTILSTLPIAPQSLCSFAASQITPTDPLSNSTSDSSFSQQLGTPPQLTSLLAQHQFQFRIQQINAYQISSLYRYPLPGFTPILSSRFVEQSGKPHNFSITSCGYKWQQTIQFIQDYIHSYYFPMVDLASSMANLDSVSFKPPTILVCGPRNHGKSTFLRFLINHYLTKYPMIAHFETDIGQTESSPSGVVSIHLYHSPILTPVFENLQWNPHLTSIVGSNTPSDSTDIFLSAIKSTYEQFIQWYTTNAIAPNGRPQNAPSLPDSDIVKSMPQPCQRLQIPFLVNTCGWTTGLGKTLISRISSITRPDIFIELADKPILVQLAQLTHESNNSTPYLPSSAVTQPQYKTSDIKRFGKVQMECVVKTVNNFDEYIQSKAQTNLYYIPNIAPSAQTPYNWLLSDQYPLHIPLKEQNKPTQQHLADNSSQGPKQQSSSTQAFSLFDISSPDDFSIISDDGDTIIDDSNSCTVSNVEGEKKHKINSKPSMFIKYPIRKFHYDPTEFIRTMSSVIIQRSQGNSHEYVIASPPQPSDVTAANVSTLLSSIDSFPVRSFNPYICMLTKWSDDFLPLTDVSIVPNKSQQFQLEYQEDETEIAPPTPPTNSNPNPILSIFGNKFVFTLPQFVSDMKSIQHPAPFELTSFAKVTKLIELFQLSALPPPQLPAMSFTPTPFNRLRPLPPINSTNTTLSNTQIRMYTLLNYLLGKTTYYDLYPYPDPNTPSSTSTQPPKHISHIMIPLPQQPLSYPKISLSNAGEILNSTMPIYEIPCTHLKFFDTSQFKLRSKQLSKNELHLDQHLLQQLSLTLVGLSSMHPYFSSLGFAVVRGYRLSTPPQMQEQQQQRKNENHFPQVSKESIVLLLSTPLPPSLLQFINVVLILSSSLSQIPDQLVYNPMTTLPQPYIHPQDPRFNLDPGTTAKQTVLGKNQMKSSNNISRRGQKK